MQKSFTVASISGIPVKIQLNWFLIAGLVTWSLAAGYYPLTYPGWNPLAYWAAGIFTAVMFFASVLAHEFGHALVAQDEDVPVNSITLFIFGGVAHIAKEPSTARADFRIVVAGPFTSLVLGAFFFFLAKLAGPLSYANAALSYLAYMNLVLALFNLMPGFPLDGGRILRAIFWAITKSFRRATAWATAAGYGIALIFAAAGIGLIYLDNFFSGVWIIFVGWYLAYVAKQSYQQSILYDPTAPANLDTQPLGRAFPVTVRPTAAAAYGSTYVMAGLGHPDKRMLLTMPVRVQDCQEDNPPKHLAG